jgi:hypothetical protein
MPIAFPFKEIILLEETSYPITTFLLFSIEKALTSHPAYPGVVFFKLVLNL